uniref:Reverse transcriptase domain-containing protein n=1 Tax=Oryza brachyantha TaxID=4533 RepID=J3LQ92_ORYBR
MAICKNLALTEAGFIREVMHAEWLANSVVVPKANGKLRMCIDYTDLNKCSTSITLSSQIGRNVEAYVDDPVVNTRNRETLLLDLAETFDSLRTTRMKLNLEKKQIRKERRKAEWMYVPSGVIKSPLRRFYLHIVARSGLPDLAQPRRGWDGVSPQIAAQQQDAIRDQRYRSILDAQHLTDYFHAGLRVLVGVLLDVCVHVVVDPGVKGDEVARPLVARLEDATPNRRQILQPAEYEESWKRKYENGGTSPAKANGTMKTAFSGNDGARQASPR